MYFYLSYDKPFAVKADGVRQATNVLELNPESKPLIELCPLDGGYPVYCLLCADFFAHPPETIAVADLGNAWFLRFSEPPRQGFSVLAQKNFGDALATLYRENRIKLSLETREDFFVEALPLPADGAELAKAGTLVAVHLRARESFLAVYDVAHKIQRVFFGRADEYAFQDGFETVVRHRDLAKHTERTHYVYADGALSIDRSESVVSETFAERKLPAQLIPYAFFESILANGETDAYLSETMLPNKARLKDFLGNFIGVFPPPRELKRAGVGLLYRDTTPNKYFARYFDVSLKNGKVENLFPVE